jgi:hypothetical protein
MRILGLPDLKFWPGTNKELVGSVAGEEDDDGGAGDDVAMRLH